jgi:hypothetical protein
MSRKLIVLATLGVILVLALILAACGEAPTPTPVPKPKPAATATTAPKPTEAKPAAAGATLTAAKASAAPKDGADAAWNSATALKVTLKGQEKFSGKTLDLTLKSLYTSDEIFILATWADEAASMVKGTWQFDGTKWTHQEGDEDRLAFLWEITPIKDFASKGCAAVCHSEGNDAEKWYMAVDSADQKGDLWHWKSYRSDPLKFADDGFITVSDTKASPPTGRASDPGSGGDSRNETADKSKPALMQDPAKTPSAKGFLVKGETVEIKDYSIFKAGDTVPYRILSKPDGSCGDIKANAVWANGTWTVMLSRKLSTGNADDVAFDPTKAYNFGVGVFNNSADYDKYVYEGAITLTFAK